MARSLGLLAALGTLLLAGGCSICCAPYDCNYPYTGGRWVRDNPAYGRVGSAFEPVGTRVEGDALASVPGDIAVEAAPQPGMQPSMQPSMQPGMQSVIPRRGPLAPPME
jgi:hypothetical protein